MLGRSIGILGLVVLFNACTYTSPTSIGTSSSEGASSSSTSSSGSAGSGAAGGEGGTGSGGSGGSGGEGGGTTSLSCAPLPPPSGSAIMIDSSQAAELPEIVAGAMAGTTIVLKAGTYVIPSTLTLSQNGVTLRSETDNAEDVVIDGEYNVSETIVIAASNVTVAHVTITRAKHHPIHIYPPGPAMDIKAPLLYGLRIIDGGQQFIKVNPSVGGYVDNGRVECSLFELTDAGRANPDTCCAACYPGGVDVQTGWKWVVRNNTFKGIYCDATLAGPAIHFWKGSRDTLVENNHIFDCGRGIGIGFQNGGGLRVYSDNPYKDPALAHYDGIIRNNVIYGNVPRFDTGIEVAEAKQPRIHHNTVIKGPDATGFYSGIDYRWPQTYVIIRNNLTSNTITARDSAMGTVNTNLEDVPLEYFSGPDAGDFHLTANAILAIDKGAQITTAGIDIDGEPHSLGNGPDIGADEVNP